MSNDILTDGQRRDLASFTSTSLDLNDSELLSRAADRIGMEGELAIDPDGILELELDDVIVVLESVADEDRDEVDHPDMLHMAVLLRAATAERRGSLVESDLVDEDASAWDEGGEWVPAWWGSMATRLPQDAPLSTRLEALTRAMQESHGVLERRDLTGFFDRMAWLQMEDEDDADAEGADDE
jgi:hypothetical protein